MSGEDPYRFDNRHQVLLRTNARTELGCPTFAPIFALGAAIDYVAGLGIEKIAERILALNMYLHSDRGTSRSRSSRPTDQHRSAQTLVRRRIPPRAAAFLASATST